MHLLVRILLHFRGNQCFHRGLHVFFKWGSESYVLFTITKHQQLLMACQDFIYTSQLPEEEAMKGWLNWGNICNAA